MKKHIKLIAWGVLALVVVLVFLLLLSKIGVFIFRPEDGRVTEAKIQQELKDVPFFSAARRISFVGFSLLGAGCVLLLSLGGYRKLSVHTFQLGQYRSIKVRWCDMPHVGFIAEGLVLAEQMHEHTAGLKELVTAMQHKILLGLQGTRGSKMIDVTPEPKALPVHTPTFREMFDAGNVEQGQPLTMGFADGEPQQRSLEDIKALAVAGWQGSGKTLSIVYMTSCLLLQYPDSQGWVIDPHKDHPEGLANYLEPYTASGRLTIVNPFDTRKVIEMLDARLNARLAGEESSASLLFLVIDELSKIGKTSVFKEALKPFLDRCTEETRKANILFVGAGQKWQAKYYDNDASFRQSVPSLLVHKSKPAQADFLLEDTQEKKMVKQLSGAGSALLATSHDADPRVVQMPLITRKDIQRVSQRLKSVSSLETLKKQGETQETFFQETAKKEAGQQRNIFSDLELRHKISEVQQSGLSWGEIGEMTDVNRAFLYKIVNEQKPISADARKKLTAFFQRTNVIEFPHKGGE